jgi:hypothetical protein
MDRRERYNNEEETLRLALRGFQSRLWTALPGIVETFDPDKMIVSVQPSINGRLRAPNGSITTIKMPLLLDCPVLWQGGGGVTLTFPIKKGDECLVVIASRCIDAWWSQGGVQDPPDTRMHNLSDGFALVGVRSVPRAFAVNTDAAQLRSDDGNAFVEINPTTHRIKAQTTGDLVLDVDGDMTFTVGGDFDVTVTGDMTVTANQISLNGVTIDTSGNVHSPATITGATDVVAGTKSGKTHTHDDPQGGVTAGPN